MLLLEDLQGERAVEDDVLVLADHARGALVLRQLRGDKPLLRVAHQTDQTREVQRLLRPVLRQQPIAAVVAEQLHLGNGYFINLLKFLTIRQDCRMDSSTTSHLQVLHSIAKANAKI